MLKTADEIGLLMFLKDHIPRLTENSFAFSFGEMACETWKTLVLELEIAVVETRRLRFDTRMVDGKEKGGRNTYDLPHLQLSV